MSDINDTRLPLIILFFYGPYVGDDVNTTLTRGERWVRHSSNDAPIDLCALH